MGSLRNQEALLSRMQRFLQELRETVRPPCDCSWECGCCAFDQEDLNKLLVKHELAYTNGLLVPELCDGGP
jgi:hypothetical protein